jgi:DNA adenine methylase
MSAIEYSSATGHGNVSVHEIRDEDDRRQLAKVLHNAAAAVVLSGYPSSLNEQRYDGWHRAENASFNGNAAAGGPRIEVLWSNRPFPPQGALALTHEQLAGTP